MAGAKKLDEAQELQARELAATRAHIIHEVIAREGREESERSASALAWSGLAAGLSIGLSFMTTALLRSRLPVAPWNALIYDLGYPTGFLAAILGRQQLFTEDTLTPVVPFLEARTWATFLRLLRLWGIVLATNVLGAALFGWFCTKAIVFPPEIRHAFLLVGRDSVTRGFGENFTKGIFGGWLIALLTWVMGGVKAGEIALITILTYLIALGGFSHIVAGTTDAAFLVWSGALPWGNALLQFFIPTLLGNVVGGVGFVAVINHAQVVSGSASR